MPALIPRGDESVMNFESLGVFFDICYVLRSISCELGVNFDEHVASLSIATEQAASVYGQAYGEP
jgi:hypothetical protein